MKTTIREMDSHDYDEMIALWKSIKGLSISQADSKDNITKYLQRNQGLSYVAIQNDTIVGTILCGHDGRRGFIYHLAVNPSSRKQRIGHTLVEASIQALKQEGIDKCHIFVIDDNNAGNSFWTSLGWEKRSGFSVYSYSLTPKATS